MAAGDLIQAVANSSAGSTRIDMAAITEGNTLVCVAGHRAADATVSVTGGGWTEVAHFKSEIANSSARRAVAVLVKTAGDGEGTAIDVSWSTSRTNGAIIMEFEGEWTFDAGNSSAADTGTSSGTALSSGEVPASGLGIAAAVARFGDSGGAFFGWGSWTGADETIVGVAGANGATLGAAYALVSSPAEASATIDTAALWTLGLVVLEGDAAPQPTVVDLGTVTESETAHAVTAATAATIDLGHITETETASALTAEVADDAVEEFDGDTIPDGWTYVDPKGDTTLSFADGCAVIELPAGSAHDSLPANTAPKLLRDAPAGAFQIVASWRSQVRYPATQGHGLIVTDASNNTLIRADVYGDNAGTCRLFLRHGTTSVLTSTPVPRGVWGGSPSHMRLTFDGDDQWTYATSPNGFDWDDHATFTMAPTAVAKVGVHALNAGTPVVAYTARLDRFTLDSSMPAEPPDARPALAVILPFPGGDGDPLPSEWTDDSIGGGTTEQNGDGTAAWAHTAGPDSSARASIDLTDIRNVVLEGTARWHSNAGDHQSFLAIGARGTGGWGDLYAPVNGYALERNQKDGKLRLFRVNGAGTAGDALDDAYHLLQAADDIVYPHVDTDWHRWLLDVRDGWVRVKVWPDSEVEPTTGGPDDDGWLIKAVDNVNDQPGILAIALGQSWAAETVTPQTVDLGEIRVYTDEDVAFFVELGHIAEAETAHAVEAVNPRTYDVGHISETETVNAFFSIEIQVDVGHVAELESAHAVTVEQAEPGFVDLGHVTETEAAHALTVDQPTVVDLGTVTESEVVGALTVAQPVAVTLGTVAEAESVHALTVAGPIVVDLGHIGETEAAWGIAGPSPSVWVDIDVVVGEPTLRPAFDVGAPRLRWDVGEPRTRWQVGEPSLVPDRSGA